MYPVLISASTLTSCLGRGTAATTAALRAQRGGLAPCAFETVVLDTFVGEVAGLDDVVLPAALAPWDCRNNRLAWLALQEDGFADAVARAAARVGARRVGVFVGTSTSGILETELAYRRRDAATGALPADFHYRKSHNTFSVADFVRTALALEGPAFAVSTACSSSAKVFASAARFIAAGVIDAAVVGGVDTLCLTTLYGFNSLELLSPVPCRPFDAERSGISIGEAGAFALLEKPVSVRDDDVLVLGAGESSDAHHMSSPHPEGLGARMAMQAALTAAGCAPGEIGYINLHGTGTQTNDAAESRAVAALFGEHGVPASSTKGATGHTLGAAGAVEALICAIALREGFAPAGINTRAADAALAIDYVLANRAAPLRRVLSNSFGFGGTNCSLVFGRGGQP